jgi:hypothetical protein
VVIGLGLREGYEPGAPEREPEEIAHRLAPFSAHE